MSDLFTGLYSVIAIQAALRHAEKGRRGPAYRHGPLRQPDLGAR
ncbi:hypothetical protein ACVOMV_20975 [Mesorhizobium atlanticum]